MPSKRRPAKRSKGWEASLAHVVTPKGQGRSRFCTIDGGS
jgi:hypothetical protein